MRPRSRVGIGIKDASFCVESVFPGIVQKNELHVAAIGKPGMHSDIRILSTLVLQCLHDPNSGFQLQFNKSTRSD